MASSQPVDVLLDPPVAVSLVNNVHRLGPELQQAGHADAGDTGLARAGAAGGPGRHARRAAGAAAGGTTGTWGTKRPRGRRLNDGLHWMLLRQMAASADLTVNAHAAPRVPRS